MVNKGTYSANLSGIIFNLSQDILVIFYQNIF